MKDNPHPLAAIVKGKEAQYFFIKKFRKQFRKPFCTPEERKASCQERFIHNRSASRNIAAWRRNLYEMQMRNFLELNSVFDL